MFYNARDMAVVRAHLGGFPAILASATPSVESRVNADSGKYVDIRLPERFGGSALPDLGLIDMRRHPPARGGFLSPVLLEAMGRTVEAGEQALLFLNRRGYAPLTLCRVCGHRFPVSGLFRLAGRAPLSQPAAVPPLRPRGAHAGSVPGMRHAGPPGALWAGGRAHRRGGRAAFSRGPHHPPVVGHFGRGQAAAAGAGGNRQGRGRHRHRHAAGRQGAQFSDDDPGRRGPTRIWDWPMAIRGRPSVPSSCCRRSPGRAGRFGQKSHGLLQTYQPAHPVIQAIVSGERETFYEREIAERERARLPPFGRMAALIVSAGKPQRGRKPCARPAPGGAAGR